MSKFIVISGRRSGKTSELHRQQIEYFSKRLEEAEAVIIEAAEREKRHSTAGTAPAEYLRKYYGDGS